MVRYALKCTGLCGYTIGDFEALMTLVANFKDKAERRNETGKLYRTPRCCCTSLIESECITLSVLNDIFALFTPADASHIIPSFPTWYISLSEFYSL